MKRKKSKYECFKAQDNFYNHRYINTKLICGTLKEHIPFITIVIPTYKRVEVLKEAINSVLKQKNFNDFEIIVIDNDNETNTKTEKLLYSYNDERILYYKNDENLGQIGNWNRGIFLSRSEWIVLLHDDDYLKPFFLKEVTDCLEKHPEIEGLFTVPQNEYIQPDFSETGRKCNELIQEKGTKQQVKKLNCKRIIKEKVMFLRQRHKEKYIGSISKLTFKDYYFDSGIFAPTGGVYKKENIIKLGGFSEEAFPLSDWDLHNKYVNEFNLYVLFKELIVTRMGINDSMKKDIRIGFIEKGYRIRREMQKQIQTIFGEWWIQVVCWRHALGFHNLEQQDLKNVPLRKIYSIGIFKYIYFIVMFMYSGHLKFYVPLFETRNIDNHKEEKKKLL